MTSVDPPPRWLIVAIIGVTLGIVLLGISTYDLGPFATRGGQWRGDGVHVVDGYWMTAEHPCDLGSTDECVIAIRAARATLGLNPETIVGSATAEPPDWARGNGEVVLHIISGPASLEFAILDLADGSRRVAGLLCTAPGTAPDGTVVSHPTCDPTALDMYRVGHTPDD